jgi:hypothetical protein
MHVQRADNSQALGLQRHSKTLESRHLDVASAISFAEVCVWIVISVTLFGINPIAIPSAGYAEPDSAMGNALSVHCLGGTCRPASSIHENRGR